MRKASTIITVLIILIPFLAPFAIGIGEKISESVSNDYARITDVDYKAVVVDEPGSNGKVIVTERLTYDIHAASEDNLFWELWKALPESEVDGAKVRYKVNSVKQILGDNGEEIIYEKSPKLYWDDEDFTGENGKYGPGKWFHSEGPYNESQRRYECVLFYVNGLYREKVVFEIEYEISNVSLRYNDCSELYLTLYSEETINYLKSFKGQILFPHDIMPRDGNYEVCTCGTNENVFPYEESATKNPGYTTFSFELGEEELKFRPYNQYIEFILLAYGEDKHKFTQYASKNNYYYDDVLDECRKELEDFKKEPGRYKSKKQITLIGCVAISTWILILATKTLEKQKKKYNYYEPETEIEYFRDIPSDLDPHFAAALVFCKERTNKYKKDEYSAIMLSLIRKKYIEIERLNSDKDWVTKNIKIVVKNKPIEQMPTENTQTETITTMDTPSLEPLSGAEQIYYNLIVKYAKTANNLPENEGNLEITFEKLQKYISSDYYYMDSFISNIDKSVVTLGMSKGYFKKENYTEPRNNLVAQAIFYIIIAVFLLIANFVTYTTRLDLVFGGFIILAVSLLISALHILKISKKCILLTQFGENEYAKWRGLYNFLNSETLINEKTVVDVVIWEKYLVYATAFGISEKVIKALKIRCPEVGNSAILSNHYYHSSHFYHQHSHIRTVSHNSSSVARSGGHGGYGGAGRGGGGGGGGH